MILNLLLKRKREDFLMAIFNFVYKKKNYKISVKELRSIFQKAMGLMFKKNSKPLLFIFDKPTNESIHSFFCRPFIAIWFLDDRIVGVRFVEPWLIGIKPREKFNRLLEIPSNDDNFKFILEIDRKV